MKQATFALGFRVSLVNDDACPSPSIWQTELRKHPETVSNIMYLIHGIPVVYSFQRP